MLAARTSRIAARLLLGAMVLAFAMLSAMTETRAGAPAHTQHAGLAAAAMPDHGESEHCNSPPVDPVLLLCKHHCQSEIQTLDHPRADLPQVSLGVICVMAHAQLRVPVATIATAFGPVLLHPGGAPPPYAATARLRI
ncbi:MAG: hypothetical protein JNM79_14915 [Burkholderiales bacterium]|nr:hypothetical protein [Burkholderiales bacterium]